MSRALQAAKIREIGRALSAAGYEDIDSQAEALGLALSTTWTVLQGNHKHSGLTAAVIHQMLKSEKLPASVRRKIIEYVLEKLSGHHGHSKKQIFNFSRRISILRAPGKREIKVPVRESCTPEHDPIQMRVERRAGATEFTGPSPRTVASEA